MDERSYVITYGSRVCVAEGDHVKKGDRLTEGSINPHDILAIGGPQAVQDYLIQEVQRVYRMQGVDINDKHIEVIVRQMMRKVKVEDSGDTYLLPGSLIDRPEFDAENARVRQRIENGEIHLKEATCAPVLLGITKASLATDSFLSAASFQETTRVLTEAAIKGKVDPLMGLKENVIIGKLVPISTGMQMYTDTQVVGARTDDPYVNALRGLLENGAGKRKTPPGRETAAPDTEEEPDMPVLEAEITENEGVGLTND